MKHVISLKNAKKLQELGVKAETDYYYHVYSSGSEQLMPYNRFNPPRLNSWSERDHSWCPTFTVGELGEMLQSVLLVSWLNGDEWNVQATEVGTFASDTPWVKAGNEADARAKMLIWLIENGHIKAEEV